MLAESISTAAYVQYRHISTNHLRPSNRSVYLHDRTAALQACSQRVLLLLLLLSPLIMIELLIGLPRLAAVVRLLLRRVCTAATAMTAEVDKDATLVVLDAPLEPLLLTQLLDGGLQFRHVVLRMDTLADNNVQVILALGLGGADAGAQNVLGLVYELTVQIDGVGRDTAGRVVFAEDVFRSLAVEVCAGRVVAAVVCLPRLVAQLIVVGAAVGVRFMVEDCGALAGTRCLGMLLYHTIAIASDHATVRVVGSLVEIGVGGGAGHVEELVRVHGCRRGRSR